MTEIERKTNTISKAIYRESDVVRRVVENQKAAALPGSGVDPRSPFQRDRDRILHSAALRRLADKTQVVCPRFVCTQSHKKDVNDTPRNRLTHSLEVSQIGRVIASGIGCDIDLVELAGLAHDIGHPPYGHNGERALDELAADIGGFEGNAQNLRILTSLEPKILDDHGNSAGLNLTRASLDAILKYPWTRREQGSKFGAYDAEAEELAWIREDIHSDQKSLEAQIMDWSDDVAYSVHDVEDGILSRRINLRSLIDKKERSELAQVAVANFGCFDENTLIEAAKRLLEKGIIDPAYDYCGTIASAVALKQMTSELIGRFSSAVIDATRYHVDNRPVCRYEADLQIPEEVASEVIVLKTMSLHFVFSDKDHLKLEKQQRDRIHRVAHWMQQKGRERLDTLFLPGWDDMDYGTRLRVIVDQIASMTESRLECIYANLNSAR